MAAFPWVGDKGFHQIESGITVKSTVIAQRWQINNVMSHFSILSQPFTEPMRMPFLKYF